MALGGEGGPAPRRPVGQGIGRTVSTIVKLVILCFVVGFVLVFFDIQPERIFENFGDTVANIWRGVIETAEWAAPYVVTGAVIVLPIWAVVALLDFLKRRRR